MASRVLWRGVAHSRRTTTLPVPSATHILSIRTALHSKPPSFGEGETQSPPIIDVFSEKKEEWKKGVAVGGSLGVVGGLGLLGWHHGSLEMAIHIVAGLSVLGGGAAVASAFPKAKALAKSGGQEVVSMRGYLNQSIKAPSFGFTQLNSRSLPVARKLDRIATGGSQALPAGLAAKFKRADAAAKAAKKEAVAVRVAEIDALADELLEGGVDPAEIYQRCFPRTYVVSFEDPPRRQQRRPQSHSTASAVAQFSGLVSLLVDVASKHDEVVIKMTSPGGGVSEYGQLAMQVLRLRKAGITTTVCIDTVAASGGYMAACVADKVFASPFAFVGSIGVVAEMPNVSKVLKKQNVDWMLFTAGKYKRTVHPFAEVTEDGKEKFQEQLEDIHTAFRDHVAEYRDQANPDDVATGEAWLALQALQKGLVDELLTSDEYIQSKLQDSIVIEVKEVPPQPSFRDLFDRSVSAGESLLSSVTGLLRGEHTADIAPVALRSTTPDRFRL